MTPIFISQCADDQYHWFLLFTIASYSLTLLNHKLFWSVYLFIFNQLIWALLEARSIDFPKLHGSNASKRDDLKLPWMRLAKGPVSVLYISMTMTHESLIIIF